MSDHKWNGMCPAGKHGLDFKGQACGPCAGRRVCGHCIGHGCQKCDNGLLQPVSTDKFKALRDAWRQQDMSTVMSASRECVGALLVALDRAEMRAQEAERERDHLRGAVQFAKNVLNDTCGEIARIVGADATRKSGDELIAKVREAVKQRDAAQKRLQRMSKALRHAARWIEERKKADDILTEIDAALANGTDKAQETP